MTLVQRVAYRYLKGVAAEDALARVGRALEAVTRFKDDLAGQVHLVADLIRVGEARRLERVTPLQPSDVRFDGHRLTATVKGTSGVYSTHITFSPQRGHHCTCPDWIRNGKTVGPCKHVLALGLFWQERRLAPTLESLEDRLDDILAHSEIT